MPLSSAYQNSFEEMLAAVGAARLPPNTKLSTCWPDMGIAYRPGTDLLVVGRAINGFEPVFEHSRLTSAAGCAAIAQGARTAAEANRLSWLSGPGKRGGTIASTSAFWRVVETAVTALPSTAVGAGTDWMSRVAWTNLAKVAPADGGNPKERLHRAQRQHCVALLRQEVEALAPRVVLVVAGADWCEAYADGMPWRGTERPGRAPVLDTVNEGGRHWLFCSRPERRKEHPFKAEVLSALNEALAG